MLLATADLIPYEVQRIAHELWDYAELKDKRQLDASDVNSVADSLVAGQSTYYELLWEQLSSAQRGTLQALAERGHAEIYSQAIRNEYRLGPASTVQKALQALDQETSWTVTRIDTSSSTRYFPAGSGRRLYRLTPIGVTPEGIKLWPLKLTKRTELNVEFCLFCKLHLAAGYRPP